MAKKILTFRIFFPVLLGGLIVDRVTKVLALQYLPHSEIDPAVGFVLHMNTRIAFSLPIPGTLVSICAFIILMVCLLKWGKRYLFSHYATSWMLGLIFGGAFGNILDRILYGSVVDFVKVFRFPVFNIADVLITVGALVGVFWYRRIFR